MYPISPKYKDMLPHFGLETPPRLCLNYYLIFFSRYYSGLDCSLPLVLRATIYYFRHTFVCPSTHRIVGTCTMY